jgi:hypothetical protein
LIAQPAALCDAQLRLPRYVPAVVVPTLVFDMPLSDMGRQFLDRAKDCAAGAAAVADKILSCGFHEVLPYMRRVKI